MKTTLYTLCTAALLLASCANDPAEDILAGTPGTNGGDLPQGTFVIDYTASTGDAQTRLPANERIQSLDYLLYEKAAGSNDFLLKYRRTIPDIGENTIWPLTRETMTWAQREALKDTLNQSSEYKMVFVANADAKIWDNKEVLQNVTEGSSTFDNGRLVLPPRLFSDKDMYYLWSNHDTPLVGSNYNKNNPASMEITLQRMINKVEVKLDEDVVNGIEAAVGESYAEKVDAYVTEVLSDYYDMNYDKAEDNYTGELDKVVWAYMDDIATKIDEEVFITQNRESRSKQAFKNKFINPDNKRKAVVISISKCIEEDGCNTNYVKPQFISEMKDYFTSRCNWSQITNLTLSYTASSYASAISFNKETETKADATTTDATTIKVERDTEGRYIFYTFGNNQDSDINTISSISFKTSEGTEVFNATCNIIPGDRTMGGNWHFLLTYTPTDFLNISINSEAKFTFTRENYNIQDGVLDWSWDDEDFEYSGSGDIANTGWKKFKMIRWVNSLFYGNDPDDENYQDAFEPYTLTLDIPKIEIVHPWITSPAQ